MITHTAKNDLIRDKEYLSKLLNLIGTSVSNFDDLTLSEGKYRYYVNRNNDKYHNLTMQVFLELQVWIRYKNNEITKNDIPQDVFEILQNRFKKLTEN